jgi:hypothetical protein
MVQILVLSFGFTAAVFSKSLVAGGPENGFLRHSGVAG